MARLQPRPQTLRREGDGIGTGDPHDVEAELPGAVQKGALERLPVPARRRPVIRAGGRLAPGPTGL
jgi:hypothetical protein